MEESTTREKILKKIRDALIEKSEVPYPIIDQDSSVYPPMAEALDVTFAEELVRVAGKFVYCESEDEFTGTLESFILEKEWGVLFCQDPTLHLMLKEAGIPFESNSGEILETRISLTRCEYLIARQGSVMVSSRQNPGRKIYSFPEIHLVVAYSSQLVPDLKQALAGLKRKYRDDFPSMVSLVTGPSRTADIEKTLVMGAHGPRELYVFLIDDSSSPTSTITRMSNFWSRTITGLSMVFILLAAIWFSGWFFSFIFLVITILGIYEFYGLIESEACRPQKWFGIFAGTLVFITTALSQLLPHVISSEDSWLPYLPFLAPIPFFFFSFIFEIYRNRPNPLANIAMTNLGYLYIAMPFSLMIFFAGAAVPSFYGMPVVLAGYFAFTWINDTGTYLYGRQFGRHKFFERISPKKTWEGTVAGALVTLLSACLIAWLIPGLPVYHWLAIAALVVIFGTHGDLAESLIKRSLNIKDSGTILPGHGGILDRFDTMLISAPFVFLYLFSITLSEPNDHTPRRI